MKRFFTCFIFLFGLTLPQSQTIINSGWQYSDDKTKWETVNLPHTWNKDDAFDDQPGYRRGLGYYQKKLFISSGEKNNIHYLKFNAVNQVATVFVNGNKVGSHKGGYTAFNFDVTEYLNYDTYNLIEVTVDNSFDKNIPPLDADFTFYGGIYRDVEVISLPKQHFSLNDFASDGFYVNYYDVSEEKAGVEVTSIFENYSVVNSQVELKLELFDKDGSLVKFRKEKLKLPAESSNEFKVKLPVIFNPNLWSPENPYLYQLKLTLTNNSGQVLDSKNSNIGFRWASVDPEKGFFLNGKPIKLVGVNKHQDYKGYGNAVPIELQKKDLEILKEMGGNVMRFSHYPHSRELYDICDKLGILVWTEIPIINLVTKSAAFFETCINMQTEHVKQYYNYPSVVMFGYMNEIFLRLTFDNKSSETEKEEIKTTTFSLAEQLENLTRKLAPNHITVMACNHFSEAYNESGVADLPMLLGWNLYFGWYEGKIPDLGTFLDDLHKENPERSLFLSEYGPGADVRIFTKTPRQFDFSTAYQAKLHQSYYQQIMDRPYMSGMTAWNFIDFGSEFRGDAIPHVNQKGLLQYDRTPKDIYYWYQSVLVQSEPILHIATDYLSGLTLFDEETFPIQVFSNQEKAAIYLNGEKLRNVIFEYGVASLEVPFKNGINNITAISDTISKESLVEVIKIQTLDFKKFKSFGINLGSHFYFKDNDRQITFVPDQTYKKGRFGYFDGTPFGMTEFKNQGIPFNIRNTNSDPLFQTMLEGCNTYKVDLPDGTYRVSLFFVEPQIKSEDNIYNLTETKANSAKKQRIFDVYLNDILLQKQFNMAAEYPEKYGITLSSTIRVENGKGLTVSLKPIEGKPVISGILIEKQN